jgi:ATP-dependent DNA helicase DinG
MNITKHFPSSMKPRPGQLEALGLIDQAFKAGKKYFVYEGPTGAGKSAVAKAVLNAYESGIITAPLNTLVSQYANDHKLAPLAEVRGMNTYQCHAFETLRYRPTCEEANDEAGWKAHTERCSDYIVARDNFWQSPQSVTNVHYLYYAHPIEGARWPRRVLVIDEAHKLEESLIDMGKRTISPKRVSQIKARIYEFPGKGDKELLDRSKVANWLTYFSGALADAIKKLDGARGDAECKERAELSSLQEGVELVLNCGDWIAWLDTNKWQQRVLNIAPMSAVRPAHKLFQGFDHILLASATIGRVPLFLHGLGIEESQAEVYCAPCEFPPENRPIFYRPRGRLGKTAAAAGFDAIVESIRQVLRDHEGDRGIVHCHSNALRDRLLAGLSGEFGTRILTHGIKKDRDAGVQRLRMSRNGVLLSVAMCEGLNLEDDDARFCIIAKVPWPDMGDPYVKERMRRDEDWYPNQAALAVVQGSGRVVRHAADRGETYIFDQSFERLVGYVPYWWLEAWK